MFKKTALAIAALFLLAGALLAQEEGKLEKDFEEVRKQAEPRTVLVRTRLPGTNRDVCGSGAVISAEGLILTCSHVVPVKDGARVTFTNGKMCNAKSLGQNFVNDYALLKVEAKDLPYFELGSSGGLEVGQPLMALGFPGGSDKDLKPWNGYGKVVALNRNLPVQGFERFYVGAVKTDIRSMPGNSGGPLVTAGGKLVGINGAVMIFVDRTYAIPIDAVKADLAQLKTGKDVEGTGIKSFAELMKELQNEFTAEELKKFFSELSRRMGEVTPQKMIERFKRLFGDQADLDKIAKELGKLFGEARDGLAETAKKLFGEEALKGLEEELQKLLKDEKALEELGKEIEKGMRELEKLFGGSEEKEEDKKEEKEKDAEPPEGDELDREIDRMLELVRKRLEEREKAESAEEAEKKRIEGLLDEALGKHEKEEKGAPVEGEPYIGVRLSEVEEALKYQLDIEGGLLIDEVRAGSPAAEAGLKAGDIVVRAGGRGIASFEDLAGVLGGRRPGDALVLEVIARGKPRKLELKLGAR